MLAEEFFSSQINNYVEQMTDNEQSLLRHLRLETQTQTKMSNMLSGPVEGKLLQTLIALSKTKTVLEVGTFTGYATLNMAQALPIDGKLITLEYNQNYANIAKKYFNLSPHGHKIDLRVGNAQSLIPEINEAVDFAFIDADKKGYPLYYDLILPKLNPGGLIIVDNALWGGKVVYPTDNQTKAIHALNQKAKQDPRVETLMLTVRDGILLIRKK